MMCDNKFFSNLTENKRTARHSKRDEVKDLNHQLVSLYQNKDWYHPNEAKDLNTEELTKSLDTHLKLRSKNNKCRQWPHLHRRMVSKTASCSNQSPRCMACRLRNAVCASCVCMSFKHNLEMQYQQIARRVFEKTERLSKNIYDKSKENSKLNSSGYDTIIHIDGTTVTKVVRQSQHSKGIDGKSEDDNKGNETNNKGERGGRKKTMIYIRLRRHRRCKDQVRLLNLQLHNRKEHDTNGKHLKRCKIYIKAHIPKKSSFQNDVINKSVNFTDKLIPESLELINACGMSNKAIAETPLGSEVFKTINYDKATCKHDTIIKESIVPILSPKDLLIMCPSYSSETLLSPKRSTTQCVRTDFDNNNIADSSNNINSFSPDVNNIDYGKASFSNGRCLNYNCVRMTSNFSGVPFRNNMMIPRNFGNSGDNIRASELKLYENNAYLPCHPMMSDCGSNGKKACREMCDSRQFFNGINCIYSDQSGGTDTETAINGNISKTDDRFETLLTPFNNCISNNIVRDCNFNSFENIFSLQHNTGQVVNRNPSITNMVQQQPLFHTTRYKKHAAYRHHKIYRCNTIDYVIIRKAMSLNNRNRLAIHKNKNVLCQALMSNSTPLISRTDCDTKERIEGLQETKLEVWNSNVDDKNRNKVSIAKTDDSDKVLPMHNPKKETSDTCPHEDYSAGAKSVAKQSFPLYFFYTNYIAALVRAYKRDCSSSTSSLLQNIAFLITITVFIAIILVSVGTMLLVLKFIPSKPDKVAAVDTQYKMALKEWGFD